MSTAEPSGGRRGRAGGNGRAPARPALLVADPSPLFLLGLAQAGQPIGVEVATTSCPAALQRAAGAGRADVLLVNPALWADDWQRLEDLPARCHRAAVGVLAESPSRKNLERAVRYGFDAYLEKRSLTPLLLASVVRTLLGGGCAYLTTEQGARVPELSAREVEVLRLLRDGCSVREIATCLYLGERTIKAAINSAARRLGAHNRAHAVALGYGLGLLAPSERHAGPILRG